MRMSPETETKIAPPNWWNLVQDAGFTAGDGAKDWAEGIYASVVEALEYADDADDISDALSEVADGSVPIYYYEQPELWAALQLWAADLEDLGGETALDKIVGELYQAGYAVAQAALAYIEAETED